MPKSSKSDSAASGSLGNSLQYQRHILFVFRLRCSWAVAYLLI